MTDARDSYEILRETQTEIRRASDSLRITDRAARKSDSEGASPAPAERTVAETALGSIPSQSCAIGYLQLELEGRLLLADAALAPDLVHTPTLTQIPERSFLLR
jgi:hypothetical protein